MSREVKKAIESVIPPTRGKTVTPSDETIIDITRGLYIGTGGDLVVEFADSADVITLKNVANGTLMPGQFRRVLGATSASDIIALYN